MNYTEEESKLIADYYPEFMGKSNEIIEKVIASEECGCGRKVNLELLFKEIIFETDENNYESMKYIDAQCDMCRNGHVWESGKNRQKTVRDSFLLRDANTLFEPYYEDSIELNEQIIEIFPFLVECDRCSSLGYKRYPSIIDGEEELLCWECMVLNTARC